jgi:hypothetical protein
LKNNYKDIKSQSILYINLALSNSIYDKYIAIDDEKIVKTIRKIFIIYQSKLRQLKSNNFLKWKFLTNKIKIKENKIQEDMIYVKKKSHEFPLKLSNDSYDHKIRFKTEVLESNEKAINLNSENAIYRSNINTSIDNKKEENVDNKEIANLHPKSNSMTTQTFENLSVKKKKDEIFEKLYHERHKKEILNSEIEKNFRVYEMKQCTFSPSINKRKSFIEKNQEPRYLHLYENRKEKEERIRKLSIEKEKKMRDIYTFEPNINSEYRLRHISNDFKERLRYYETSKNQKIKKIKNDEVKKIPIPKPQLSRHSSAIRMREKSLNISLDNVEKIREYQFKKKEKIKKIEEDMLLVYLI